MHVSVHVKEGMAGQFIAATIPSATASRLEPGCLRFDVLQV